MYRIWKIISWMAVVVGYAFLGLNILGVILYHENVDLAFGFILVGGSSGFIATVILVKIRMEQKYK